MFPMLPSFLASALVLSSVEASSFPQRTIISNTTKVSSSGAAGTGCANQCFRNAQPVGTILWSQIEVTATVTAETLLVVVNNRTNGTKTSTIINTKIDPNEYAPATTNSAGTVTTSVVLQDKSTKSTRYIAYPTTGHEDYPSTYSLCGTVKTTINGSATCLTYQDGCDVSDGYTSINHQAPTFTLPSHPPPPESIDSNLDLGRDPKGWTYSASVDYGCSGDTPASDLLPDLGVWACTKPAVFCMAAIQGPRAKSTALLLTATSTSTEANGPSPSSARNVKQDPVAVQGTPTGEAANLPPPSLPTPEAPPVAVQGTPTGQASNLPPPSLPTPEAPPVAVQGTPTGQASNLPPPSLPIPEAPPVAHGTKSSLVSEHGSRQLTAAENTALVAKVEPAMAGFVNTLDHAEIPTLAVPVQISTTDGRGRVIAPSRLPTLPESAPAILLVPISGSYIDAQRNAAVSTNLAAIMAVPLTSTNARGEVTVSTSLLTSAVTVSTPIVLTSTNAQGSVITSTSYLPAILLTTSDARGSQLITTSPILPAVDIASNTNPQDFPVLTTSNIHPAITAPPALTIGAQTVTANSQNQYIIGSQTLTRGGRIVISGITILSLPGVIEVISGTSTEKVISGLLPDITSPLVMTIGSQAITADSSGQYVLGSQTITINSLGQHMLGSQTLTPGGVVTIAGTRISLAPGLTPGGWTSVSGTILSLPGETGLILGTSTEKLTSGPLPKITPPAEITIGSQTITADSSGQYTFGSQTLTPGGVITIGGTRISLAPGGTEALVGSSTESLAPEINSGLGEKDGYGTASASDIKSPPAITIGRQTVTADSLGHYVFGSQTLTPGGVITIAGTRISLAPDGTEALVGSSTKSLAPEIIEHGGKEGYGTAGAPNTTSPPAITIGSQTITADSSGRYVFGSQTLIPGGAITIAGSAISLAPDGTEAVIVSSTEGLGPYIMGGLGGKEGHGNASAVLAFTGAATQGQGSMWGGKGLALMGLAVVILL